jgi:DNA-binding NarL/FixJ family response regulator
MSAADVTDDVRGRTAPAIAVVGRRAGTVAHVRALLAADGLPAEAGGDGPLAPGTVLVLAGEGRALQEARAVQYAVVRHPDGPVLAILPAGAPNAALRRALQCGAAGIVLQDELESALPACVRAVAAGLLAVPERLRAHLAPRPLSFREKQILSLVVRGCTNREIAERLFIAESTVKTHLASAFAKLDATSRAEATSRLLAPGSGYGLEALAVVETAPPAAAEGHSPAHR